MERRRLGRTNFKVSVVGFGTCQLRLVPESQAIDTLLKGFDLGVNLIHTAPDYEGAEAIVAKAMARTRQRVIVAAQGYDVHYNSDGPVRHFEHLFEATCRRFRTDRLDLFGIACVDDREAYRENVWGTGGMVEFLMKKKAQGRLGGTFCTTHGNPEFIKKLVRSGAFDAIMVAYNELGFHLLSYNPPPGRHFESLPRNRLELFPLCRELDVGVMVMKPLAGGLLCRGQAFPPRFDDNRPQSKAGDVLRSILECPDIACVLPGTASVAEAEENARAGHKPLVVAAPIRTQIQERISLLQTDLCSRCGLCDTLCSQGQRVSWMFRAGYVSLYPSETYETWDAVEYFNLHPKAEATCASCPDVTCGCPYGIDVPRSLTTLHNQMLDLRERGLVARATSEESPSVGEPAFRARVVLQELPRSLSPRQTITARIFVENVGTRSWFPEKNPHRGGVALAVSVAGGTPTRVSVREDIHPGGRCHFVFPITATRSTGALPLRLQLLGEHEGYSAQTGPVLFEGMIDVQPATSARETPIPNGNRRGPAYAVEWREHNLPTAWPEGTPFHAFVRFVNRGSKNWMAYHPEGKCVDLVVTVDGGPPQSARVTQTVAPGGEMTLGVPLVLGKSPAPYWELTFSLVEQHVAWFADRGATPLVVRIDKAPPESGRTAEALAIARRSNNWGYQPTNGVPHGRDGRPYPLFVSQARGCRMRDLEDREWIDYVMGWGSALLGYAHPAVQAAVTPYLNAGSILALPHELEMQVTDALCARFPGADAALFGKNGSDVCTAAVRIARVFTGRRKILFSGYHGWQDWYAESMSAELAAPGAAPSTFRFRLNDLGSFCRLIEQHRGEIAAVVLEPAAQVEGVDGPVRDADPAFLGHVATICREQGILLVFDEIMTGFRYRAGSVQQATGVVPDLTCLGKALTSGWPLSALLGRREILEPTIGRIFYHPTFKGEAYSFAAALAALEIYTKTDIPGIVHSYGERLINGIARLSVELGIAGRMVGQPYRMVYRFDEPDLNRRALKRTLLIQELMKNGVLTFRGFMLPSLAHGDAELVQTLEAFRTSLQAVQEADNDGSFAHRLEIPLVL